VVETYLQEPALFGTYIALDPSVWWNDSAAVKARRARDARGRNTSLARHQR
jgi:predicted alpha/beta superfamily hydrolase